MCGRFMALPGAAKIVRQLAVGLAAVVLFGGVFAQAADLPVKSGDLTWGGLGFGLGIAADFDVGGKRVVDAELVTPNNIVRVKDSTSNVSVGFVLEAHYFLKDFILNPNMMCTDLSNCRTEVGMGPFVAVEVGNSSPGTAANGPITGYALGWMVGLHHIPTDPKAKPSTSSWNFGVGLRIDPNTQVLGDGIVPNQPLPPGETAIRFKKEPRAGIMLLSSFSF